MLYERKGVFRGVTFLPAAVVPPLRTSYVRLLLAGLHAPPHR